MSNQPLQGDPIDHEVIDQGLEAGGVIRHDAVLEDLRVRNIAEAVVQGRPGAEWDLGALIGELLCGGLKRQDELPKG